MECGQICCVEMLRLSSVYRKSLTFSRWALVRNCVQGTATVTPDRQLEGSSEQDAAEQSNSSDPPIATDPPTPPPVATAALPFRVTRTKQHNLPVYSDYKRGRSNVYTIIRKIEGDLMEMDSMLRKHLNKKRLHTRLDELTGQMKIQGDHRDTVRDWLKSLGF